MNTTQEEIFPLVDKDGNVIGKEVRSKCHNGSMLLHPVIHLHVFNSKKELYLQKRSADKEIFPNLWDSSVGGHIELDESIENAVIREATEELNLQISSPVFILKHIIKTQFEQELTYCFYVQTDQIPIPNAEEVSDGRFWKIEEIAASLNKNIFTPNFELDFTTFLYKGIDGLQQVSKYK